MGHRQLHHPIHLGLKPIFVCLLKAAKVVVFLREFAHFFLFYCSDALAQLDLTIDDLYFSLVVSYHLLQLSYQ